MDYIALLKEVIVVLNEFATQANISCDILKTSTDANIFENVKLPNDFPGIVKELSRSLKEKADAVVEKPKVSFDNDMIQITVPKAQLDQRIEAFISHAQNAVDDQNIQEFFPRSGEDMPQIGCARTHALYRRRASNRTHMQVNRVKNIDGPQTQVNSQGRWCASKRTEANPDIRTDCPVGTQERLLNLETHLRLNKNPVPKDVYSRIKVLEERMLELESRSPEYFCDNVNPASLLGRRSNADEQQQASLVDIDDRIRHLKQKLLSKKFKPG